MRLHRPESKLPLPGAETRATRRGALPVSVSDPEESGLKLLSLRQESTSTSRREIHLRNGNQEPNFLSLSILRI